MTQIDQLLRQMAHAVERDDEAERRAIGRARRALDAAVVGASPSPVRPEGGRPRRVPRRATGFGLALAAAATAAGVIASGTTNASPAFALTRHADGSVTLTINELPVAIPALNAKFAAMGLNETIVPVLANCTASGADLMYTADTPANGTVTWMPGQKYVPSGENGVLGAERLANGRVAVFQETVQGPVPSCLPATPVSQVDPQTGVTTGTVAPATSTAATSTTAAP